VLLAHAALTQVVTFVVRPGVTYRAIDLGVPAGWLGALAATFAVVPLLLAVPAGQLTDRFGERRVMLTGSVLMVASVVVLLLAGSSPAGLAVGTAVLGTGQLLCVLAQQALVANSGTPRETSTGTSARAGSRGARTAGGIAAGSSRTAGRASTGGLDTAFGHYTFAVSLGQAVGPGLIIAAGGRSTIPDTTAMFAASGVLALVMVAAALALSPPAQRRQADTALQGGLKELVRLPGLPRALVVSSLSLAAVDITLVYVPALGTERGWAAGFVGALLTVRALSSMTTRLFLGTLVQVLGRRVLLVGSSLLAAVSIAGLALPAPLAVVVCFAVLLGLALGAVQPMTMAWLATSTPAGLRGRAMSLRLTGNRLGQTLIPSLVGGAATGVGTSGVLLGTAGGLLVVAALARGVADTPTSSTTPAPTTDDREAL